MATAWHVATTHLHAEAVAVRNLRQQGFRTFLPLLRAQRLHRGIISTIIRPYIPGYLFIEFDVELQAWRYIHATRGIRTLLSSSAEAPSRIRGGVVEALILECDRAGFITEQIADSVLFRIGTEVKMIEGPFKNMRGTVMACSIRRVRVVLHLLGRSTVVDAKVSNVALSR